MRQILLVIVLLIATTCFATERLVFLSGDSEEEIMSQQLPPSGDGVVYTELFTPITAGSPICDLFPGDWVGNGAWAAQHSIQPDRAAFALGCNNGDTPLPGARFKGNAQGFLAALQYALMTEAQEEMEGSYGRDSRDNRRWNEIDDIVPMYHHHLKHYAMQPGDVLHLWIQGTGGMVTINGIETPCFYLAWPDDGQNPPICELFGGVIMVPSYTGDSPDIVGLKQILDTIEGNGRIILNLVFAHAGAWTAYLSDYIVWAGCEAHEYVYICNGADENRLFWPGFEEEEFWMLEPSIRIANAWIGYRNSDGAWAPGDYDLDNDSHIWFSEAGEAAGDLDDQHGTVLHIPAGEDFRIWNFYSHDDPMGGGGSPPAPEIYPNPFFRSLNLLHYYKSLVHSQISRSSISNPFISSGSRES